MTARDAGRFAHAIVARYGRRAANRPLGQVLRRHVLATVVGPTLTFRPLITVSLHVDARQTQHASAAGPTVVRTGAGEPRAVQLRPVPRAWPSPSVRSGGMTAVAPSPIALQPVMRHSSAGDGRAPARQQGASERVAEVSRRDVSAVPSRVLRREAAAAMRSSAAQMVAPPIEAASPAMVRRRAAIGPDAAATTAAPVDMRALTDQVIRTIDQRIAAHRERMGRI